MRARAGTARRSCRRGAGGGAGPRAARAAASGARARRRGSAMSALSSDRGAGSGAASSRLTGASTPSRNCISEKPDRSTTAVAAAPTAIGTTRALRGRAARAGARRRSRPPAARATTARRVCTSARSRNSPTAKPKRRPAASRTAGRPPRRPAATGRRWCRTARPARSAATCTMTVARPSAVRRGDELDADGGSRGRRRLPFGGAGQHLDELQAAQVGERAARGPPGRRCPARRRA